MDPNAALLELRELSKNIARDCEADEISLDEVARMAELFEALDGWLSKSGFLPTAWKAGRP